MIERRVALTGKGCLRRVTNVREDLEESAGLSFGDRQAGGEDESKAGSMSIRGSAQPRETEPSQSDPLSARSARYLPDSSQYAY